MIVPMKKATIIVQSKDGAPTIDSLGLLGVLHIEHRQVPKGKDVDNIKEEISLLEKTIGILSEEKFEGIRREEETRKPSDWKVTAQHVADLRNRLEQLKGYSVTLRERIDQWKAWGDFDPEMIRVLSAKGIFMRLYQIPAKEMKNLPPGTIVEKISVFRGNVNCAIISREMFESPYNELTLPKVGLSQMEMRLSEDARMMKKLEEDICRHTCYRESLERTRESLKKELEFHEALRGMGQSGELMYLTGYVPHDAVDKLLSAAKKEKWGIVVDDPSEEDMVPTLIRNPRWISLISNVFKVIEIVPGYRELDISLWFLVFFSIFFGILIGDAGYGLIFLGFTFYARLKWRNRLRDKSIFVLFYILSLCAVVWGLLTGTFFGQEWLPEFVKPLLPALRNDKNMQAFCFFLGAVHLSIAHLWRAVIKVPSLKALAEIGWILILWAGFFLAKMLVLGCAFPAFGKWLFIAGIASVIFFTNPTRSLLKSIGTGFGALLLNFVSSLTDVVSYIRLFAVGLAGVAIADAFNAMAMNIGYNSILRGAVTTIILVSGHLLNILLGPLAIIVHGVRLNVLEFCSHLDIRWSGFPYKPLEKERDAFLTQEISKT